MYVYNLQITANYDEFINNLTIGIVSCSQKFKNKKDARLKQKFSSV